MVCIVLADINPEFHGKPVSQHSELRLGGREMTFKHAPSRLTHSIEIGKHFRNISTNDF